MERAIKLNKLLANGPHTVPLCYINTLQACPLLKRARPGAAVSFSKTTRTKWFNCFGLPTVPLCSARAIASPRWTVPPVLLPAYILPAQNSESRNLIGRILPITALHFSEISCKLHVRATDSRASVCFISDLPRFCVFGIRLFCCFWVFDRVFVSQFWCALRLPVATLTSCLLTS